MFVVNEAGTMGRYHRIGRSGAVTIQERARLAKSIDKTIADANRRYLGRAFRPVALPTVVAASTPALAGIAEVLRDERQPVSRAALEALETFLTHGADSALYGRDAFAARREAETLRTAFSGLPEPTHAAAPAAVA